MYIISIISHDLRIWLKSLGPLAPLGPLGPVGSRSRARALRVEDGQRARDLWPCEAWHRDGALPKLGEAPGAAHGDWRQAIPG